MQHILRDFSHTVRSLVHNTNSHGLGRIKVTCAQGKLIIDIGHSDITGTLEKLILAIVRSVVHRGY